MPHCSGHSLTEARSPPREKSLLILTCCFAHAPCCPYLTISALRVQIECAGAGKPCLRHDFESKMKRTLPCLPQRGRCRAPALRARGGRSHLILGSFSRGEQAHSCEEPGGLFAACELGNAPLFGAFPDRSGVSLAPPRRWLAEGKTEGLLILPAIPLAPPVRGEQVHSYFIKFLIVGAFLRELSCCPMEHRRQD